MRRLTADAADHALRQTPRFRSGDVMSDNQIADRYHAFFGADFMPLVRHEQTQGAPERQAYADEYAAYHLGQINKKLGRLIELLEQSNNNGDGR
jgi:hypothetical protein